MTKENERKSPERKYIAIAALARERVEGLLPIVPDHGGHEGLHGSKFHQEVQRLMKTWRSYAFDDRRRLGVGRPVFIPEGTPIQVLSGFYIADYVTSGIIKGVLIKETTMYPADTRPPRKRTGGMRWREFTNGAFTVQVPLPGGTDNSLTASVLKEVNILVPHDMVYLARQGRRLHT